MNSDLLKKLGMPASVLFLALAMAGCSSSSDDDGDSAPAASAPAPSDSIPSTPTGGSAGSASEQTPAEQLAAAQTAVAAAETAVGAAATDAERATAYAQLADARTALTAAENLPENITASQRSAVTMAIAAAKLLVDALIETSSQAEVDTANVAITDAQTALDGAMALPSEEGTGLGNQITGLTTTVNANDVARDRHSVSTAVAAAQQAVDGLSSTPTAMEVTDANTAVTNATAALDGAMNLPPHEASAYRTALGSLGAQIMTASSTGEELAAARSISDLYTVVQTQRSAAKTAADNAGTAAKDAAKYVAMRTTEAVRGESETARENSQAVLDAGTNSSDEVMAAEAAKTALEALDTADIDAVHKAALDQAIEEATEYVVEQITAAKASEVAVKAHVADVEGSVEDMPREANDDALAVAMSVNTALGGDYRLRHVCHRRFCP